MNTRRKKGVGYIRSATTPATEQRERQAAAIRAFANERGIEIVGIYHDEGCSGMTLDDREGLRALFDAIEGGQAKVDSALLEEPSRWARDPGLEQHCEDRCRRAGVAVHYCAPGFEDYKTPVVVITRNLKRIMEDDYKGAMNQRAVAAQRRLGERGELHVTPPTGYVWDTATRRLMPDRNERVHSAIRTIFECFRREGSAGAVSRHCAEARIKLPSRRLVGGKVRWVVPTTARVVAVLVNPVYAGVYVWGRRKDVIRTGVLGEEWEVFLPDQHPRFITLDEFGANQRRLPASNATKLEPASRPRPARRPGLR